MLPNDKQELLEVGNYEIYNRELTRSVFPRIIAEVLKIKPRTKIGDIIPFYFALLSHIDGNEYRKNGELNERYGYSFISQERIYEMTGIDRKRHPELTKVLEQNGIIKDVRDVYEGTRRYIWYRPLFCAKVSEDGYVIDENGERIVPNYRGIIV